MASFENDMLKARFRLRDASSVMLKEFLSKSSTAAFTVSVANDVLAESIVLLADIFKT
ncbi:hypothetical protein HRI96_07910 [Treponema parvum]|uniref:Uncharacterized protein n=1 Tax=Treponema parvum TaxID=138851 RepID=A0A975F097_9SPIR|nr:hypothetical protein [Treponema parvum]QTQ12124.1 hypothetical protein HRI96_07910 [Treponema parvum]